MHTRNDGSDKIVSLDALKISRHGSARSRNVTWEVHALIPFAKRLMVSAPGIVAATEHDGIVHRGENGFWVTFHLLDEARAYCADIERAAEQEPWK